MIKEIIVFGIFLLIFSSIFIFFTFFNQNVLQISQKLPQNFKNLISAANVNITTTSSVYNISGDIYNVEIDKNLGIEKNLTIYGQKFVIDPSYQRLVSIYNSTDGNVSVDLLSYNTNLMVVESGPARVVLHGENLSSINAGFPAGTALVSFNFTVDVYAYPRAYYFVYRVFGNFTKLKIGELAGFSLIRLPANSFVYYGRGNTSG